MQNPNQANVITKWYLDGEEFALPFQLGQGVILGEDYNIVSGFVNGGEVTLFKAVNTNREILDIMFLNPGDVNITFEVSSFPILNNILANLILLQTNSTEKLFYHNLIDL